MAAQPEKDQNRDAQASVEPEQTAPAVFQEDDGPFFVDWIARGSDGNLYKAPAVPGGWLQRTKYDGPAEALVPVSPEKARTITWFLYGDVSDVTIARQ